MSSLYIVGASKFALDIHGYLAACRGPAGEELSPRGFLAVEGEEAAADPARTAPFDPALLAEHHVVFAVAEPKARAALLAAHGEALRAAAVAVVHPTALLAAGSRIGAGNIIGPYCCVGANSRLGDLNVLNYQIGFGHHSRLGDGNFLAPGFQCGNTVTIGDGNYFGLSCTVGPDVKIGDNNRFQAGAVVLQPVASDLLCFSTERLKVIRLPGDSGDSNVTG
jgi:UDP-3-O-[3-hydroxymyristoyl] glucosamine N-acyltransferase